MRLDLLLIRRHPSLSRRRAREVIEKGQVSVAGQRVREAGLEVAQDAVVVFDPNRKVTLSAKTLHQRVDYTPYEGRVVQGAADVVLSRGEVIVKDGRFLGRVGRGEFLKRKPRS